MDFRVACVILSLVASVGADAFTFADGASASCVAGGKIVKEVDAEPSQAGLNFTGKTVRISSGFLIIWNAERLKTLPPEVHDEARHLTDSARRPGFLPRRGRSVSVTKVWPKAAAMTPLGTRLGTVFA